MNIAILAIPAALAVSAARRLALPRSAAAAGLPAPFDVLPSRPALRRVEALLLRARTAAHALTPAGAIAAAPLQPGLGLYASADAAWYEPRAAGWKERLARALRMRWPRRRAYLHRDSFGLLECAPVAAFVLDAQGHVLHANGHAARLFQYQHAELSGMPVDLLVPHLWSTIQREAPASRTAPVSHDAGPQPSQTAPPITRETRVKRRDGSDFPAQVALHAIQWQGAPATLGFVCDRTESYELKRDRQELAHLTRVSTLGELAGSLAHELNQPLTAILSNVQAAQRFIDHEPPDLAEVREILNDIVDDSCRASEVIRRIRAFVKKEELELVRLDIGTVLRDVMQLVHSDAIVRGVHLSLDIDEHLPPLRGDKVQLQQVILNLLVNAFDAVRDVEPFDRVVTAFAGRDRDGMIRVAVRDRGHGMTVDRLERIFKPFVTSKAQGLGLGLSISRSIVEMHRGRLWAEKNSDQGMTFYVTLPPWSEPETARRAS